VCLVAQPASRRLLLPGLCFVYDVIQTLSETSQTGRDVSQTGSDATQTGRNVSQMGVMQVRLERCESDCEICGQRERYESDCIDVSPTGRVASHTGSDASHTGRDVS
jgi:hypothetical protein